MTFSEDDLKSVKLIMQDLKTQIKFSEKLKEESLKLKIYALSIWTTDGRWQPS